MCLGNAAPRSRSQERLRSGWRRDRYVDITERARDRRERRFRRAREVLSDASALTDAHQRVVAGGIRQRVDDTGRPTSKPGSSLACIRKDPCDV
jgi:hypothetical protein